MKKYQGYIYTILSAIIFGLMPLGAKLIYNNGSNSITLVFHRFLFSAPFLYFLAKSKSKESLRISRDKFKKIFFLSIGYISTPVLLLSSYNYISSGTATTIHFIYPVLVLLGCAIFYKEKINFAKGLSCLLCMIGLLTFYTPGDDSAFLGFVLSFMSGITYAFYIIRFAKSNLEGMDPFTISFYLSLIGSVELLLISIVTNTLTFDLTPIAWVLTILLAVFTSAIGTILFQKGTILIGPQKSSLLSTFEPLTSVIVGVFVFKETLGASSVVGIILILISVVLLSIYDR
ncbi:DMT family transporter [Paratissierella segnis]|jgi:drug/metabolite transporter (DMT)-like permease|uniref:DMT family transporter n=1 Tax=Paratissierella segnis TaxID=2763679 RepID=A0A926EU47_9FIRM|nr:DMT family transporter [Paratissierella segnis]MBC8587537.1 DMT family transporter [Paratissierella segnis]